jgi:hypothetical protein
MFLHRVAPDDDALVLAVEHRLFLGVHATVNAECDERRRKGGRSRRR